MYSTVAYAWKNGSGIYNGNLSDFRYTLRLNDHYNYNEHCSNTSVNKNVDVLYI